MTLIRASGAIGIDPDVPLIRSSDTPSGALAWSRASCRASVAATRASAATRGSKPSTSVSALRTCSPATSGVCDELRVVCGAGSHPR